MKRTPNLKELIILIPIIIVALVGLLGWVTGELKFARFSLLYIPMAPSTAVSFLFLVLSLFFVLISSHKKHAVRLSVVLASSIIVMGSIVLTRFLFDFNWDIENLFLRNPDTFEEVPIGRMSPLTAGLFVLYGISVLLRISSAKKNSTKERIFSVIVISSLYLSSVLLIGYLYKAPLLYGMGIIPVALPTAICFWLFGYALFSLMEFNFLFFIKSASSVEKRLARMLIPLTLFIVIIYGVISSAFYQDESPTILSAGLLIVTIPVTAFIIIFISKNLGQGLNRAEQAAVESENKLKDLFRYMNEGFALHEIITDESGKPIDYKYLEINPAFSRMTGLERDQAIGQKVRDIFPGIENDPAKWIEKFGDVALNGTELTFEDYSQAVGRWFIAHAFCPKKGQFAVTFSDITDRKKLDLKLKESEKKFKELFDNMIEGFAVCELLTDEAGKPIDFRYLTVNPEFGKILGLNTDEVIGKTLIEVFPGIENDEANWIGKFGEVALTGKQISFDDYSENEDKWFFVQAFSPQSGQFAFTFTDITDRKKASIDLENSENKFRALVEQSLTGIYIFEKEKFLYVNKRFCEIFGYTEAEIMSSLKPTEVVAEDERANANKNISDRLSGKTDSVHYIAKGNHKNGKELWIEIHGTHINLNEKDVITGTVLDITERRIAEKAIQESTKILEIQNNELLALLSRGTWFKMEFKPAIEEITEICSKIINTERVSVWWYNEDYSEITCFDLYAKKKNKHSSGEKLVSANFPTYCQNHIAGKLIDAVDVFSDPRTKEIDAEYYKKYDIKSLLDVPVWLNDKVGGLLSFEQTEKQRVWTREDERLVTSMATMISLAHEIKERRNTELELIKHRQDLEKTIKSRTKELENKSKDLNDNQNALLNIVEDLNEKSFLLEESAKKLESANKELESFTYSVSHDLKAPLRGIDGYSKLLLDLHKPSLDEEAQRFIETIRRSTLQMNQIIDDLLNYSRLERSRLNLVPVKIKDLIESVLSIYNAELEAGNFEVNIDLTDIEVIADSKGLTIALRNLIENAIKFSKNSNDPLIQINIQEKDSSKIICVRDNGVGFDMQYHQKIFDIFQRLHRVEDFPGTGIGLAMASKAMQRMRGRVWADSEPGVGSTFYLEIPKTQ